ERGTLMSEKTLSDNDRDLVERLVLDSPDQFVLAQLRGNSYYTVARNARPENTDTAFTGAVWDIVRVDESQRSEKPAQKSWRLVYVNTGTGLIDRVISESHGHKVEAKFDEWTNQGGEMAPGAITWTSGGDTIMAYRLISFSHSE